VVAASLGRTAGECAELLEAARQKLAAARDRRIRPGRDEKILTSWNALAIRGMARAARVFGRDDWLASARRALDFIRATLWRQNERRLLATYKDGRAHLNAYLDDYAFLLDAALEMLQAEFGGTSPRATSRTPCSSASRTPVAGSSSRAMTTRASSTARSRGTTTPPRRAAASRRSRSRASGTSSASRATSRRPSAASPRSTPRCGITRAGTPRP
jgi:hypothetical protein